jgi:hypothetical protein
MSVADAELHRQDRYASIRTIEDTLALPTDFAETEALYVIAGRADSEETQNLIYQATKIRDRSDRKAALQILFLRLTELDPRSALAIARSPAVKSDSSLESSVWVAWGRLDLDEALVAAKQGNSSQRNLAGQSLYASLRGQADDRAKLIQNELGISPSKSFQGQQLYTIADESPAAAIQHIESLHSIAEQRQQFGWLAYYLSNSGHGSPADYAELIQSHANRQIFEQSLTAYRVQADPETALKELLSGPKNVQWQSQAYSALQQLAEQDPDKALQYLDQFPAGGSRRNFQTVVAVSMARTDPAKALAWARDSDTNGRQMLLASVISQIAQQDPQRALLEAQAIDNKRVRDQALAGVLNSVAQNDPSEFTHVVEMIGDSDIRRASVAQLASIWAQTDMDAAVAWLTTLDTADHHRALQQIGQSLIYTDLDSAIEMLPLIPDQAAAGLRMQIAQNLAQQRSVEEAQTFIARFKGTGEYAQLQVTALSALASSEPARAMRLAVSIDDEQARDQLYASIIGQQAATDPQQALQWMNSIASENARRNAITQIAYAWHAQDSVAAEAWMHNLPRGPERDSVILATVSSNRNSPDNVWKLIESIGDPATRKQGKLMHIQMLANRDSLEAKRLLAEMELSDAERSQYEQLLQQRAGTFNWVRQ